MVLYHDRSSSFIYQIVVEHVLRQGKQKTITNNIIIIYIERQWFITA